MLNFKWPSIYRVACPMYLWNLHFSIVSEAKNARVILVEKPQIKIFSFQNGKHGCLMQYLIRQSFEWYCCESEDIWIFFLNILVWVSAMQCNVECRLPEKDVILKEPPPHESPLWGGTRREGRGACPPLVRPWAGVTFLSLKLGSTSYNANSKQKQFQICLLIPIFMGTSCTESM